MNRRSSASPDCVGAQCGEGSAREVHDGSTTSSDVCPEFRAEAVKRVRNSDESLLAIARDLGISHGTLKAWVEASRPQPAVPLTDDERTELKRLRKEVRELRMEREI